jgi:hypothetical protein
MTANFDKLSSTIEETRADILKATEGNKAACARVRKSMMAVKNLAGALRKEMLELRDSGGNSNG